MIALTELQSLLQREIGLCRRLLTILKLTRKTLCGTQAEPLEQLLVQQGVIAQEFASVDARRQETVDAIGDAYGLEPGATVAELLRVLPGEMAGPLATLASDLMARIGDVQRVQQVNQALTRHALEYVDFNMELVASLERSAAAPPTYNPYGQAAYSEAPMRSLVNTNA